jgi:acetyl-CoA C-acetyltransferase
MEKVYIISAKRTAIGKFLGSLATVSAADMAATVMKAVIKDAGIDPAELDEVVGGNVLSAGLGQGVMRQASIKAGIPVSVPAYGINMICGSGMKAVIDAVYAIRSGAANLILAGGTESMSSAGHVAPSTIRMGHKMGPITFVDHMVNDGLTDAFSGQHMGITAENIAEKYGITREQQDAFAYASQRKAIAAIDEGRFADEIVPVEIVGRKETVVFDTDEFPNRTTSPEKLAALKPAFKKEGTVTAGNASGINDGAAFVLVASESAVNRLGLKPIAEVVATGQGGVEPSIMGMGPVPAIAQALGNAHMQLDDMEVIELNEAFAAQSLGVVKQLSVDNGVTEEWIMQHSNPNGGALALGHPIGASGARILVTLLYEMMHDDQKLGLASLCIGGGMGTAIIVRRG